MTKPGLVPDPALEQLVTAAVRAPSVHNTQPWRFALGPAGIEVRADPTRILQVIDPSMRELTVSCGAALFNLRVAAARAGRMSRVWPAASTQDATHLATLVLLGSRVRTGVEQRLYSALLRRRTSRRPFLPRRVPAPFRAALAEAAYAEGARLWFPDRRARRDLVTLTREADRRQLADPRYRAELSAWTTTDPRRGDGVNWHAFGPGSTPGSLPVRDFGITRSPQERHPELYETDPTLAVLSTEADTHTEWLRAGQALQRVLLVATVQGLSTSFMNQALENVEFRSALRYLGGRGTPQVVVRIGYGQPAPASRRRPLREVIEWRGPDTCTGPHGPR